MSLMVDQIDVQIKYTKWSHITYQLLILYFAMSYKRVTFRRTSLIQSMEMLDLWGLLFTFWMIPRFQFPRNEILFNTTFDTINTLNTSNFSNSLKSVNVCTYLNAFSMVIPFYLFFKSIIWHILTFWLRVLTLNQNVRVKTFLLPFTFFFHLNRHGK